MKNVTISEKGQINGHGNLQLNWFHEYWVLFSNNGIISAYDQIHLQNSTLSLSLGFANISLLHSWTLSCGWIRSQNFYSLYIQNYNNLSTFVCLDELKCSSLSLSPQALKLSQPLSTDEEKKSIYMFSFPFSLEVVLSYSQPNGLNGFKLKLSGSIWSRSSEITAEKNLEECSARSLLGKEFGHWPIVLIF